MTTKVCTNSRCQAYAHFVYTVAMRCVLCRCDLQPAQRAEVNSARTDARIDQRVMWRRAPGPSPERAQQTKGTKPSLSAPRA
jgi:hypothetical protein